jgi:hypothetical protein
MEPKSREPQAPAQDKEEPSLPDLGERVNAIRSRLGAATTGPWEWDTGPEAWTRYRLIRAVPIAEVITVGWDGEGSESMQVSQADADLIANAPADLAYLLDKLGGVWTIAASAVRLALRRRIERDDARAEVARLKRELEHMNRRLDAAGAGGSEP